MNYISNNRIKELVKLKQKKYREKFVVVEGHRLIDQLIRNNVEIEEIFITENSHFDSFPNDKLLLIKDWQLQKITSTKNPQEIAALVKTETRNITDKKFLLYLDDIKEPGNMGAIIRTATSAGICGIVLSAECCEIFNPKVIRSSLGTVFSFPIEIHDYKWLKEQTAKIIVTTLKEAENLYDFKLPSDNIILVIGSEAFGVSDEILEITDYKIKIPLNNNVESLNAAVAAGIILFYLKNQ
ncbi:MAG: RNA methyltransferase [Armatimonadetes bacterium]|nr:RNA methyltransferase [Armatimonadota bacterium]